MIHIFTFVWSIFNTVLRGYLVKTFWSWFLLPLFPNLPTLTVLPAIGLVMFVGVISPWHSPSKKDMKESMEGDSEDNVKYSLIIALSHTVVILASLGVGWAAHSLM